mgnify:CR=1 FL=1
MCSAIPSFPVAKAVAASSAVPVLFNPVVVKNYKDCSKELPQWLAPAEKRAERDVRLQEVTSFKRDDRQFRHFVEGGITDNLGLRAIFEIVELAGGANALIASRGK